MYYAKHVGLSSAKVIVAVKNHAAKSLAAKDQSQ